MLNPCVVSEVSLSLYATHEIEQHQVIMFGKWPSGRRHGCNGDKTLIPVIYLHHSQHYIFVIVCAILVKENSFS